MKSSTVFLETPTVVQLPSFQESNILFDGCSLAWEKDALYVTTDITSDTSKFPALQDQAWLERCLTKSPIHKIFLDPVMEETLLKAWADIGKATGKEVYLQLPKTFRLPSKSSPYAWQAKRLVDWLVAALLLVTLSPLMSVLALLIRLDSKGPALFWQWRVGAQGRLFRICKFRSMQVNSETRHHEMMRNQEGLHKLKDDPRITRVGHLLRKLSLDELPQLLNVLRGEMSLVGPRPWALYDAIRIELALQERLNGFPGITGQWQVSRRSNELDLYAVTCRDLGYIQHWSLWKDVKILLLTVSKLLFGRGIG